MAEDSKKNSTGKLHKDPNIEEQITAAFETLSDKDKELFEDTQLIHTDRDVSVETQVHHVLNLHKKNEKKRRIVLLIILILLIIGILASFFGIRFAHQRRENEAVTPSSSPSEDEGEKIAINSVNFPDDAFRQRVIETADHDQDGQLSPQEISSIIVINLSNDERIHDLTGIAYLTNLQSIDISHTGITAVDFSENQELTNLNAEGDGLTTLDLSHQLKLTSLDIRDCTSLQQVILSEPSAVTALDQTNTTLDCEKNNDGIYTACKSIN